MSSILQKAAKYKRIANVLVEGEAHLRDPLMLPLKYSNLLRVIKHHRLMMSLISPSTKLYPFLNPLATEKESIVLLQYL